MQFDTPVDNRSLSARAAFLNSPGPRSFKEALWLAVKGLCMGTADIIPGVSGGTIALITGIYPQLLAAIQSADLKTVRHLLSGQWREALSRIHLRFLLALFAGIITAIISLARIMHHLLVHHPVPIWSLFFGLIAASIWAVGRQIPRWTASTVVAFGIGAACAVVIVRLVPVQTPETLGFIFFSGLMAICAMILPGISGAFILLILGKYAFITGTLKNPFLLDNLIIIAVFACGCAVGLAGFSRVLNALLKRWPASMMAGLSGLMAGSLIKIWPWKVAVATKVIRGKTHVLQTRNILPESFDGEVALAMGLAAVGFILVFLLERWARSTNTDTDEPLSSPQ